MNEVGKNFSKHNQHDDDIFLGSARSPNPNPTGTWIGGVGKAFRRKLDNKMTPEGRREVSLV